MSSDMVSNLQQRERVGSVDALRCFAMTAVVAQHNGLLPFGWTGVWLFFVISGYVVTLSAIARHPSGSAWHGLAEFFRRRVRRIVPVYYAYIGVGLLFCVTTGAEIGILTVASLLGFFNNIAMALGHGELASWPVGHLWTISVEMQFYVLYGILLFMASRQTLVAVLFFALLAAPVLRLIASIFIGGSGWNNEASAYAIYSGSFLHIDSFATGALLAIAAQNGSLHRIARPLTIAGFACLAGYAAVYVTLNYTSGERGVDMFRNVVSGIIWGQHREVFLYSAMAAASAGLVSLAAIKDPLIHWLLKSRILQRIGEISYGAYIYHGLAISITMVLFVEFFSLPADNWSLGWRIARFIVSYTLTIALAELSFRYFEGYFIRRHRKGAGKRLSAHIKRLARIKRGERAITI
jgi:peptidoglycan/LPS O-acetylase OafA/YrhL